MRTEATKGNEDCQAAGELVHARDIPVYGMLQHSIRDETTVHDDRYYPRRIYPSSEMVHAVAANFWNRGVDGLCTWFMKWPLRQQERSVLSEIGDPDLVKERDKRYVLIRRSEEAAVLGYIHFANGIDCFCHYRHPWKGVEVLGSDGMLFNDSSSNPDLHLWKPKHSGEPRGLADLEEVEDIFPRNSPSTHPDGSRVRDSEGWIAATDGMTATVQAIVDTLDHAAPLKLTTGEDLQKALEICVALRESARRGYVPVALPLEDRSLQMFPQKSRWNHKKEIYGEEWYREAMAQIKH